MQKIAIQAVLLNDQISQYVTDSFQNMIHINLMLNHVIQPNIEKNLSGPRLIMDKMDHVYLVVQIDHYYQRNK